MASLNESIINVAQKQQDIQRTTDEGIKNQKKKEMLALLKAIKESKPKCITEDNEESHNRVKRLDTLIDRLDN